MSALNRTSFWREQARQIAGLLGFTLMDQTRIATAVSEIARNAFQYAGGGKVEFLIKSEPVPEFVIRVRERRSRHQQFTGDP